MIKLICGHTCGLRQCLQFINSIISHKFTIHVTSVSLSLSKIFQNEKYQNMYFMKVCDTVYIVLLYVLIDGADVVGYGSQPYESKAALRYGSINATHPYMGWIV